MVVGGGVSVGVDVSPGTNVALDRDSMLAVSVGSGREVFVAPKVAVTTKMKGEGQLHCSSGPTVSVGVAVSVAVEEGVGVMLGVNVGVFVFNSTIIGSSGPPANEMYTENPTMMRKSKAWLISANVKANLRF